MSRIYFLDIAKKQFFPCRKNIFLAVRKNFLLQEKKILATKKKIVSSQENIFLASEIIPVGDKAKLFSFLKENIKRGRHLT